MFLQQCLSKECIVDDWDLDISRASFEQYAYLIREKETHVLVSSYVSKYSYKFAYYFLLANAWAIEQGGFTLHFLKLAKLIWSIYIYYSLNETITSAISIS